MVLCGNGSDNLSGQKHSHGKHPVIRSVYLHEPVEWTCNHASEKLGFVDETGNLVSGRQHKLTGRNGFTAFILERQLNSDVLSARIHDCHACIDPILHLRRDDRGEVALHFINVGNHSRARNQLAAFLEVVVHGGHDAVGADHQEPQEPSRHFSAACPGCGDSDTRSCLG